MKITYFITGILICTTTVKGWSWIIFIETIRFYNENLAEYKENRMSKAMSKEDKELQNFELEWREKHGSVFDVVEYNLGSNLEWRNDDEARAK